MRQSHLPRRARGGGRVERTGVPAGEALSRRAGALGTPLLLLLRLLLEVAGAEVTAAGRIPGAEAFEGLPHGSDTLAAAHLHPDVTAAATTSTRPPTRLPLTHGAWRGAAAREAQQGQGREGRSLAQRRGRQPTQGCLARSRARRKRVLRTGQLTRPRSPRQPRASALCTVSNAHTRPPPPRHNTWLITQLATTPAAHQHSQRPPANYRRQHLHDYSER